MTDNRSFQKLFEIFQEKISNELMDEMMDSGKYPETDDEFAKDFQENYLVLTLRLMNNAVELITAK